MFFWRALLGVGGVVEIITDFVGLLLRLDAFLVAL